METSNFLSISNKKIIWELLVDSNYFDKFPLQSKNDVKIIFEETLNNIFDNKTSNDSLINLNKKAVQTMILKRNAILRKERQIFREPEIINNNNNNTITPIQQIYQNPQIKETSRVTAEDIRQVREMEFSRMLQTKQSEFSTLINSNKPKNIDFSDKQEDERIGNDMDRLVAQAIAQREKELGITYSPQTIKQADEFIKNGNGNNDENNNSNNSKPKRLIIDKEEENKLSESFENNKKQVRFDDTSNENIFFSVEENEKENKDIIINNQDEIENNTNTFSFLNKLKTKNISNINIEKEQNTISDINISQTKNYNDLFELKNEVLFLKKINLDLFEHVKQLTSQISELSIIIKQLNNKENNNLVIENI